jgi:arginine-tRNA-protein transferase
MIQDFRFPQKIEPETLDQYLANGWYRMGQSIFTTDFVERGGEYLTTIWLRNRLNAYKPTSTFYKLEHRNKNFQIEIIPFNYSEKYEMLFQKYRFSLSEGRATNLHGFLFGDSPFIIFNSLVINLYHDTKLIGAGVFDIGKKSAAGISSFYDPDYRRYSIGRYLIYKKIEYCQQNGYDYFYPGYFVPGLKAFDYKLEIGKKSLEFFDMKINKWKPISEFN